MKKKVLSWVFLPLFFIGIFSCIQSKKGYYINQEKNIINLNTNEPLYVYYQSKVIDTISQKETFLKKYEWMSNTNYGENIEEAEIGKEPYHLDQTDLDLGTKIIKKALTLKGLKDLSIEQFYKQIYKYFNLTEADIKAQKETIFTKDCFVFVDYPQDAGNKDLLILPDMNYTYFYPNKSMITNFPDLVYLTNLDENKNLKLDNERIDYLYHYNNYILHNSQSSLTWLSINVPSSLLDLFNRFKYFKEPKINKIGLEFAYKEYRPSENLYNETNNNVLFNLFFEKKDNILSLSVDLLKYIAEGQLNEKDYKAIYLMYSCAALILNKTADIPNLTNDERFKIASYLGYYIELYYTRYGDDIISEKLSIPANQASFYRNYFVDQQNGLVEYIKKNNYFNLPNLKDIVESVLIQIDIDNQQYSREHKID